MKDVREFFWNPILYLSNNRTPEIRDPSILTEQPLMIYAASYVDVPSHCDDI